MNPLFPRPNPVTLSFADPSAEAALRMASLPRLRWHGRVALLVGLFVYVVFGLLDPFYVPAGLRQQVWAIRGATGVGALVLFAYSWHPSYVRWGPLCLMLVGGAAGWSLLAIFWILPPRALESYYSGLLLVVFFTYNFVGTRFIYALAANLTLWAGYNLLFVLGRDFPLELRISHNFHLISANVLGGTAAYLAEFQRRRLFLAERALKRERLQLRHSALHDALTGLPNRVLLLDRIEQALSQARRTGQRGVVLFVDLDGFKGVNDTHGHDVGDQVLKEAARRMREGLRASDTLARLGGDEFVLLSGEVGNEDQLRALSDKLRQAIEAPYRIQSPDGGVVFLVSLSASMGSCFFPEDGLQAQDLLRRSDEAMYRAKRARS